MRNVRALAIATALCLGVSLAGAGLVRAAAPRFGPHDIQSVFHVSKSENQNQVHYALRLDASCKPAGKRPVFAYWQRLKSGKRVDGELDGLGTTVYGTSEEQKISAKPTGASVEMYVKALKKVRITIDIEKTAQGCKAVAYTSIAGARARLSHAYLQLGGWGLMVKYVDVVGYRVSDGKRVAQRHDN